MQVLWLSHLIPYPPKSGALLRSHYLLRAVASRHEVDLVAFIQEPLLGSFYPDLETALADCRRHLEPLCRSVTFLPITKLKRPLGKLVTAAEAVFTRDGYMANWLKSAAAEATLSDLCRTRSYDVAHFDHESLARYRPLCSGTPTTLGHHNAESHMLLRRADNERRPLHRFYFAQEGRRLEAFERRIAPEFACHITCSELDNERLRPVMPDAELRAVPNGVDVDYFQPRGAAERPQSLIFISSMSWYPNVDAVLFLLQQIWPAVLKQFPAATLDIIGSNAPASVIESARAHPNVTLHGYVDDIRPLLDSASVYVCPVRDGGGTKLKVLDALAMGKAIVAHPVACEGITVTQGKDVLFAETPDEFVARIGEVFGSPARRESLGSAARDLATAHYSFEALGAEFTGILERVARHR